MKKLALTFVFSFTMLSIIAQSHQNSNRENYAVLAPDGSIAITITDNFNDATIKLESSDNFYKYQLLDTKTSEPVFSSYNRGTECIIDKSKVAMGMYKLRVYTKDFIITSKISVSNSSLITETSNSLAM